MKYQSKPASEYLQHTVTQALIELEYRNSVSNLNEYCTTVGDHAVTIYTTHYTTEIMVDGVRTCVTNASEYLARVLLQAITSAIAICI